MDLTLNPLFGLNSDENRPHWVCRHSEAKITDYLNKRYVCLKCNPKNGRVKICPQKLYLSVLRIQTLTKNMPPETTS
jgi:hypothetical protein